MELDIVGVGFCCLDILLRVEKIPRPEEGTRVLETSRQGGGMVATAMVAAARLGARCGFVGWCGDDAVGRELLAEFARYGVDTSAFVVRRGATSNLCYVLVDSRTAERSFVGHHGTAAPLQPGDLSPDYIIAGRIVHLGDEGPTEQAAARWARQAGRLVAFDGTSWHGEASLAFLPLVHVHIVSRFYAAGFAEALGLPLPQTPERALELARRLRGLGPDEVIITLAEQGCVAVGPEGERHVPAFSIEAVDTTGAGDVFHGAYLYALLQGWPAERRLSFASAAAALKCRRLGGRAGIPTRHELEAFLAAQTLPPSHVASTCRYEDRP